MNSLRFNSNMSADYIQSQFNCELDFNFSFKGIYADPKTNNYLKDPSWLGLSGSRNTENFSNSVKMTNE